MKTSSKIPNQLLKLFSRNLCIVILTLSLGGFLASTQQIAVTYNDTRQSLNQTQALSCDLAPANSQQIQTLLSNSNVNKNILNQHEDLDNAAATTNIVQTKPANVGANSIQDQETSPSVTSIHQVWTSSSSGGIGELSPEIISKLRNDVPFLAAYALRPRLVGASSQDDINNPVLKSTRVNSDAGKQLISNSQPIDSYVGQIQPPASVEKASLQVQASSPSATKSLIPKLGDFSEFNVETSSTSKSEHHHKRKTTLKRNSNDTDQLDFKRRGSGSSLASQSVKGGRNNDYKRMSVKNKRQKLKAGKTNRRGRKGGLGSMKNRLRSSNSRAKLNKGNLRQHMNIIKRGRYYQEQSISPTDNDTSTDMVIDSKSAGDQTTMVIRGSKGASEGDIKGGSPGERKQPFYSRAKPTVDGADPMSDVNKSITNDVDNSRDDSDINSLDRTRSKDEEENRSDGGEPDEDTLEEPFEPPRRVGDDDVDEEGDTVTVMPKSDGVDDDPEIPAGAPEEDQSGPADGDRDGNREREEDGDGRDNRIPESQDEPRARRVDRERPNPESKPNNDSNNNDNDDGGRDITAGGGIGATTGGGGVGDVPEDRTNTGSTSSKDDGRQDDGLDSDQDQDKFGNRGGSSVGSGGDARTDDDRSISDQEAANGRPEMGKESNSSDDEEDNNRFDGGSKGVSRENSDSDNGSEKSTPSGEQDEFGLRRSGSNDRDQTRENKSDDNNKNGGNNKPLCPNEGLPCLNGGGGDDEGSDVDYRDEMAESALGKKKGRNETTEVTTSKVDEQSTTKKKKKFESEEKDCDDHHHHKDGHYDHHEHGHHDHHDSIKWLQDAIPGEPGEDYPILSRINLSNFNCRDQKYPGYYADVQSRCQVFHICQADGRQDSFLCPNGTIFSQISTVCVWWNSFDCEDAPKYYERNSLLYKTPKSSSNTNIPLDDLKPLDGARINRKDMTLTTALDEEDDTSSIDGLIRAMRKKENPATESGVSYYGQGNKESMMDTIGKGLTEDDEASVQRKSTNIEPDSSLSSGTSSRLRRAKGRRESRRKRRASVRQAPPKLKSRRVSRNSRRRKLRHGIKPKRRA